MPFRTSLGSCVIRLDWRVGQQLIGHLFIHLQSYEICIKSKLLSFTMLVYGIRNRSSSSKLRYIFRVTSKYDREGISSNSVSSFSFANRSATKISPASLSVSTIASLSSLSLAFILRVTSSSRVYSNMRIISSYLYNW